MTNFEELLDDKGGQIDFLETQRDLIDRIGEERNITRDTAELVVETIRALVEADGFSALPGCPSFADHRRRQRLPQQPQPAVEAGSPASRR